MSHTRERYFEWILVGLILILGGLLFYQALPFLNGTLGAITLYILLRRVNLMLANRFSPGAAPWIITIGVTIFVMLPLSAGMWYLIDLVQNVNFDVQVIIKRFTDTIRYLERTTHLQIVSEKSVAFITAKGTAFMNMLMAGINNAAINLFTTILILFFLLSGGVRMERSIARCLPFSDANKHTIISRISVLVRSNAIGIPVLAMIQGGVAAVGYMFCGLNNPIAFGVLTGFASMIPIVGSMLVWIPLAIAQYFEQGLGPALYIAGYGMIVISQCDNVLRMFMQKRMADTHPLITIFGVIAGLPLFGFMGLIFGPLLVAMFLLFLEMFIKQYIIGTEMRNTETLSVTKGRKDRKIRDGSASAGDSPLQLTTSDKRSDSGNGSGSRSELSGSGSRKGGKGTENQAKSSGKARGKNSGGSSATDTAPGASRAGSFTSGSAGAGSARAARDGAADDSTNAWCKNDNSGSSEPENRERSENKSSTGRSRVDFKTAKAESKQQKREAARMRAQEERNAYNRHLAKLTLDPDSTPANLAERAAMISGEGMPVRPGNRADALFDESRENMPGRNLVSRAVSQAIQSFDRFDDLDNHGSFTDMDLFKDDYLTDRTREEIGKKHRNRAERRAGRAGDDSDSSSGSRREHSRDRRDSKDREASGRKDQTALFDGDLIDRLLNDDDDDDDSRESSSTTGAIDSAAASNSAHAASSDSVRAGVGASARKRDERSSGSSAEESSGRADSQSQSRASDHDEGTTSGEHRDGERASRRERKERSDRADRKERAARSERNSDSKSDSRSDSSSGLVINPWDRISEVHSDSPDALTGLFGDSFSERRSRKNERRAERNSERSSDGHKDRSERSARISRNERNDRAERGGRGERGDRGERSSRKADKGASRKNERSSSRTERGSHNDRKSSRDSRSSSRNERSRSARPERRSRNDNLGYQVIRNERRREEEVPILRTVVSHQFGNFEPARPRSALKTQLVSMHTARGTMVADTPRRKPSRRRPYH